MLWIYLALFAYLISAFSFIIDKHLLSVKIQNRNAYAFGVAILSSSALFLIPFGVSWQGFHYFFIAFLSGVSVFLGILLLYEAVLKSDVSVASTQTGTIAALFTYIFSVLILKTNLPLFNFVAFLFLVIGIFLLGKAAKHILLPAVASGVLLGLYYVLLKLSFSSADFINGLFWTRVGFAGTAVISLLFPRMRLDVKSSFHGSRRGSKILFVVNKIMTAIGFIILYISIDLGNVSIVNALLGFQFMFVFLMALTLKKHISGIGETVTREILTYKVLGIICVIVGLIFLFK